MKKYIKPETVELVCSNPPCEMITVSSGQNTSDNWNREEDMYWDEEESW